MEYEEYSEKINKCCVRFRKEITGDILLKAKDIFLEEFGKNADPDIYNFFLISQLGPLTAATLSAIPEDRRFEVYNEIVLDLNKALTIAISDDD